MKTLDDLKIECLSRYILGTDPELNQFTEDVICSTIDCLHAQGLLMVWQPIETAPKDGTEIYTLLKNGRVAISSYNCFTNPKTGEHTRGGFYCDCPRCDTNYGLGYNGNPIAWMPLPKCTMVK